MADLAGTAPTALQDVLVGGAVVTAISVAFLAGTKVPLPQKPGQLLHRVAAVSSLLVPCRLSLSSVPCARAQGEPPALPATALASLRWDGLSHTGVELVLLPAGQANCGSSMHYNSAGSSGAAATTAQAQAAPARLCRACERPYSVPSVYRQRALLVQQVWREWVHRLTWPSPGFFPVPSSCPLPSQSTAGCRKVLL